MEDKKMGDIKQSILETLTPIQKLGILLAGINDYEPIRGKTWYQKELFLVSKNIKELEEMADYQADFIGPYSEAVKEDMEQLKMYDIVDFKGYKIKLTDFGKEIFESIEHDISPQTKEIVSDFKTLLNDMDQDELLGFIYFTYPEMTKESLEFQNIKKHRKNIAKKLYFKGKVSLGKAAEIAGQSLEDFTDEMKKQGVAIHA